MRSDQTHAEELARKILHHSRRRITHIAPILLEGIYALPEKVRTVPGPLSTDGRTLWFHPNQVIEDFRKDRDYVARQLLHVTVHCLLGHLEMREEFEQKKAFDCTADLKAAQFVQEVCGNSFSTEDGQSSGFFPYCPHLMPLYDSLVNDEPNAGVFYRAGKKVRLDDHRLWIPPLQEVNKIGNTGNGQDGGKGDEAGGCSRQTAPNWDSIRQAMLEGRSGQLPGRSAGMLNENFSIRERGMSYAEFLRRFASPEERMLLDPDSFDIRWYYLGLESYGNVPLLEPSELSEPPLPDDIVIALDTSGSCCGELCKRLLKETLGILRDISAGAYRFRVLLLQCDTEIQQEVLLESSQQVEELFQNFQASGFGGTDFCPVFERVEQLRKDGTLPRVRGLLYLSDGWGAFPEQPADYPTTFLIPADEVPHWPSEANWITRLYLNENDFTVKEANAL